MTKWRHDAEIRRQMNWRSTSLTVVVLAVATWQRRHKRRAGVSGPQWFCCKVNNFPQLVKLKMSVSTVGVGLYSLSKGKIRDTWYGASLWGSLITEAHRYGTRCQWITQFYLLPTRLSTNRMNHTCLCLPSRSLYDVYVTFSRIR